MATLMFDDLPGSVGVFVAPPGQGKTFIMLLFALYIMEKRNVKKVYLFTPHPIVSEQMRTMLTDYLPSDDKEILIRHEADFSQCSLEDKTVVFILDEGDEYLKRHAIDFKGVKPSGLNALRGHTVYFVTATYDDLSKRMLQEVFNPKTKHLVEVPSINALTTGNSNHDVSGTILRETW